MKCPECLLQAVEKLAKSFKARMTVRLAVAGAFHTSYMKPAEETLRCTSPSPLLQCRDWALLCRLFVTLFPWRE